MSTSSLGRPPLNDGGTDPADGARATPSRRDFIRAGAAGIAGTTLAAAGCRTASGTTSSQTAGPLAGVRSATPAELQNLVGDGRKRRILLRGGVMLSLDPKVGDFENGDVLTDGRTIAAIGRNLRVAGRGGGRLLGHDRHARFHYHAPSLLGALRAPWPVMRLPAATSTKFAFQAA